MAYERSSLISRSSYSGMGGTRQLSAAGLAQANAAQTRVLHLSNVGDDTVAPPTPAQTALTATLTSTPVFIGAAVAAYFMFRKKRR